MNATVTALDFAPLLPWSVIAALTGLALIATLAGGVMRLSGWIWRTLAILGIALVLANPSLVEEERDPLADVAILVTDTSSSMDIGGRNDAANAMAEALRREAETDPLLDLVEVEAGESADGTMLFDGVNAALASAPPDRIAGVVLVTDGQVHDAPASLDAINVDAPIHHVMPGDREAGDRRLVIEEAPRYGIVGQTVQFMIRVEDDAMQGTAAVDFRFEGGEPQRFTIPIGRSTRVEVPVERRGQNVIEAEVEAGPEELSLINNRAAVSVNGVRDRLRVLLVTGEPHNGARAWRDLLKSDPSVDLVHFTILRPPDRRDSTPVDELALIGFPVQELFVERLEEFDLVIFDRYRRRNIMPPLYFDYIARYVDNGGALLVTAGPPFAGAPSLYRTPLAAVLPVRPTGYITDGGFTPETTETGLRHPVTAGLAGGGEIPQWGRWLRHIHGTALGGDTLLETPDGHPLLVLQRSGEGRAAIVMSDQTWLWARGFEGGGPYAEMFRRVAHWLMREPELDEERLTAYATEGELHVDRVTLADDAPPLEITWPDGREETVAMGRTEDGRFAAVMPAEGSGLVRLRSGDLTTVAALGPINPVEYADLRPTGDALDPFVEATGGGWYPVGDGADADLPALRRTRAGADQAGRTWLGLTRNERYVVEASTRTPLLPGLLAVLLLAAFLGLGWWREGR
ncbi:glutamine amidotransferase [Maricaulis virginensis]|uniref:Membrane protein n=1 Tax=Maricaulis virginensis TaxID=144022 RepID=A0A9W6IKM1_9PROT|nr:glutamine amidotransferase [Maricaulis virginensis]GLK51322.1 membrane protein [Maricaulis virginensis]